MPDPTFTMYASFKAVAQERNGALYVELPRQYGAS